MKLSLVNNPFTNNEISKKNPREHTKKSLSDANIYALAQARYPRINFDRNHIYPLAALTINNGTSVSTGHIDLAYALSVNYPDLFKEIKGGYYGEVSFNFRILSDPNCYFVVGLKDKHTKKIVKDALIELNAWQVLFFRSRGIDFISGFDNYTDFLDFKVHYIGKTTKNLYDRLSKGHHARGDILSSERTINNNAMLGEELVVLPFKVDLLQNETDIHSVSGAIDVAEKLLISAIRPKYNQVKYENISTELLKSNELNCYQLIISDAITLTTDLLQLSNDKYSDNPDDCIMITLDEHGINTSINLTKN